MQRTVCTLALTLIAGVAIGALGGRFLSIEQATAQQAPVKRTVLQKQDIPGAAGKEATLILAEIVPGGAAGRHFHPGPEIGYVMEGTLLLEIDGKSPLTIKAGESFLSTGIHDVKNPDANKPVRVIDCLVGDKGKPLATPAP
jgi:quercetin dioxygenase-like cupin family protein